VKVTGKTGSRFRVQGSKFKVEGREQNRGMRKEQWTVISIKCSMFKPVFLYPLTFNLAFQL
jgi:hypothetical protein